MLVEIKWSGNGGPPGFKGVATTGTTLWARFGGGPWRRVRAERSQHKLLKKLEEVLELDPPEEDDHG